MKFRAFLLAMLAALPAAAQPASRPQTLRVAPETLTTVLDPHFSTSFTVRDFSYLVFDTLLAVDDQWRPQPQMAEKWEKSADGMVWTFTLRDGLAFHDGAPVTAEDCVASLKRWGSRDALGGLLMRATASLEVIDAKSFRLTLKEPFALVLEALSKPGALVPMILPRRLAETPATTAITTPVGSGPYRFMADEYRPGDRIVLTRNTAYRPRPEPAVWGSGGKVARMERVELVSMPDVSTQVAALLTGEVDYLERVPAENLPLLERSRDVTVKPVSRVGYQGIMRFNHLLPPFDDVRVRRAVMLAVDQGDYLPGVAGKDEYQRRCLSMYGCGTPFSTESGMPAKPDFDAAKRALQGLDISRPVVIIHPADAPGIAALGLVSQDLLTRLGFKVDLQTMDLNTYFARRARQDGWNLAHTTSTVPDMQNPITNPFLNGAGRQGGFAGWPQNAGVEKLRADFTRAADPAEQRRIAAEIHQLAAADGFYMPLGQFLAASAWRANLSGVLEGPAMFLWNIERK
jgi:peptide/nickel transport system substrate-binding protein